MLGEPGKDVGVKCTVSEQMTQCAFRLCINLLFPATWQTFLAQTRLVSMFHKYQGLMRAPGIRLNGAQCSAICTVYISSSIFSRCVYSSDPKAIV